jgi:hypothetical protein
MTRVTLGILLALLACVGAWAQGPADSWDNLKQLRVGQKIEVVEVNLKSLKGTFTSFSEEAISLRTDGGEVGVRRDDVFRVTLREGSKRLRNTLIGMGIGAAGGVAAGVGLMERETGYAGAVAGTVALFAGIGAGIGAAFPGSRTIYRAPKR